MSKCDWLHQFGGTVLYLICVAPLAYFISDVPEIFTGKNINLR